MAVQGGSRGWHLKDDLQNVAMEWDNEQYTLEAVTEECHLRVTVRVLRKGDNGGSSGV